QSRAIRGRCLLLVQYRAHRTYR
ncbi:hypothetical protein D041_3853B, partial [Vibrio parahaemolyticus EKP-008]